MNFVNSTNRRAVNELLSATRIRDRVTETRAAAIVEHVRKGGDAALSKYARELDGLTGGIEVPRRAWQSQARTLAPAVRTAITRAA
ncbi:MAG: histidinol dehydrogenase, partial [Acidobacteriota bacterium]|nr:histidinol dehydrogenase [Acidobacteriota bacterium]